MKPLHNIQKLLTRFTFLGIAGSMAFTANAQTHSLPQLLDLALENSIEIRKSILDQKEAAHLVAETKGTGLPQVNASGRFEHYPNIATQILPGEIIGQPGTSVPVQFGTAYNASGGIDASQLLFDQRFFTGLKAAKSSEELYLLMSIKTTEDVIYNVSALYFQNLELLSQIEVLDSNIAELAKLEEITKARYENQLATKLEYNRVRVNKSNLESQVKGLHSSSSQLHNQLKLVVGVPSSQVISLNTATDLEVDLSALQFEKIESSTTKVLEKQKELNLLENKSIKAGYYPTLSAFGNYSLQAQRNEFDFFDSDQEWFKTSVLGLQMQVPIFDGLQKRHQVQQSKLRIQKLELDEEMNQLAESINFENAKKQLSTSLTLVNNQEENQALAKEVYEQTRELYQEDVASLTELLDAESAYRNAKSNYIREVLRFKIAELDLLKAQGQLQEIKK